MKQLSYNKFFPTPRFLSLSSVGLDFSDHSLRFVELTATRKGLRMRRYAEEKIPEGLVQGGRIINGEQFSGFLSEVRKKYKLKYVRVSLPEEHVYSFTTVIDTVEPNEVRSAIELSLENNIPIKAAEAVFDFAVVNRNETTMAVHVIAAAEQIASSYYDTFEAAGLIPVSFELEAGAIARSIIPEAATNSFMVVDFGDMKTGISIIANGLPVYTSTLDIGGAILTQMIAKEQSISFEEAEVVKKTYGISSPEENKKLFSLLVNGLSSLKDEINRRYIYWHTKKTDGVEFPPIEAVLLCGGDANLKGLSDYLSANLKLPVRLANPWQNMFSLDEIIPDLTFQKSLTYVTAIGLALGDYNYD